MERYLGADINMICTQPRRISAIGVADRVAQERAEQIGGTVGYSIRLECTCCMPFPVIDELGAQSALRA